VERFIFSSLVNIIKRKKFQIIPNGVLLDTVPGFYSLSSTGTIQLDPWEDGQTPANRSGARRSRRFNVQTERCDQADAEPSG
jgi:hypothetical protein